MQVPTTSIVDRAVARLRSLAQGNGMDPEAITLLGGNPIEYTIPAILTLTPRYEVTVATPQEMKQLGAESLPSVDALRDMMARSGYPADWWDAAISKVRTAPSEGWGLDNKALNLPQFTSLYAIGEACPACKGRGRTDCGHCQGSGRMSCERCIVGGAPSGKNPQNPNQPCPLCHGQLKAPCRVCNANGYLQCPTCRGKGQKTTTYALKFFADTRFDWGKTDEHGNDIGSALPTPLRRSVDRSGLGKLAGGHATVTCHGLIVEEGIPPGRTPPQIRYTATLPFAEVQLAIAGQRHRALVLGHKAAVLELYCFLDEPVEKALQEGRISDLRIHSDAQVVKAKGGKAGDLLKLYPAGLSTAMAEKVIEFAGNSLRRHAMGPRFATLAAWLILTGGIAWGYFVGGLRGIIVEQKIMPSQDIDLLIPAVLVVLYILIGNMIVRAAIARKLRQKRVRSSYFNTISLMGILLILVVYSSIMYMQPPHWLLLDKLYLEGYIKHYLR